MLHTENVAMVTDYLWEI